MRKIRFAISVAIILAASPACNTPSDDWHVAVRDSPAETRARLIGLDSAGPEVAWVSGTGGTYGRSSDSGDTWTFGTVPGADSLEFRDVHAVDLNTAYLLSIGPGEQSRIYKTDTGGAAWELQWTNPQADGFFDCFDFWSPTEGIAMGDAVDGRIVIVKTTDGRGWDLLDRSSIPQGVEGEGGFAASGTCLVTAGDSTVWIGTGSKQGSRVYRSSNRGDGWDVFEAPVVTAPEAAGITSLVFLDTIQGYAAGAALASPDEPGDTFAATFDGGATWELRGRPQLPNVYGLTAQRLEGSDVLLAVGPKGMDASFDGGRGWTSVDKRHYWSVHFLDVGRALAVGPGGRISRITVTRKARG